MGLFRGPCTNIIWPMIDTCPYFLVGSMGKLYYYSNLYHFNYFPKNDSHLVDFQTEHQSFYWTNSLPYMLHVGLTNHTLSLLKSSLQTPYTKSKELDMPEILHKIITSCPPNGNCHKLVFLVRLCLTLHI